MDIKAVHSGVSGICWWDWKDRVWIGCVWAIVAFGFSVKAGPALSHIKNTLQPLRALW